MVYLKGNLEGLGDGFNFVFEIIHFDFSGRDSGLVSHDDDLEPVLLVQLLENLRGHLVVEEPPVVLVDGEHLAGLGGDEGAVHVEAGDLGPGLALPVGHDEQPAVVGLLPFGRHLDTHQSIKNQ